MSRTRGATRTRFPGGEGCRPKRSSDAVTHERARARLKHNWRIIHPDDEPVLALEPGRDFEQVFEGGLDPFWEAVEYAAACLRGEADPAR